MHQFQGMKLSHKSAIFRNAPSLATLATQCSAITVADSKIGTGAINLTVTRMVLNKSNDCFILQKFAFFIFLDSYATTQLPFGNSLLVALCE